MGAVRFLKPWSIYNPGEVAGFDEATTATLIGAGVAEAFEEAPAAKPAKKGKKAPATDAAAPEGDAAESEAVTEAGADPA